VELGLHDISVVSYNDNFQNIQAAAYVRTAYGNKKDQREHVATCISMCQ